VPVLFRCYTCVDSGIRNDPQTYLITSGEEMQDTRQEGVARPVNHLPSPNDPPWLRTLLWRLNKQHESRRPRQKKQFSETHRRRGAISFPCWHFFSQKLRKWGDDGNLYRTWHFALSRQRHIWYFKSMQFTFLCPPHPSFWYTCI